MRNKLIKTNPTNNQHHSVNDKISNSYDYKVFEKTLKKHIFLKQKWNQLKFIFEKLKLLLLSDY